MTHPNIQRAVETITIFAEFLPEIIGDLSISESVLLAYESFVVRNADAIAEQWQSEQAYYLNFYNVFPADGEYDEFKNIYFIGVVIARELFKNGYADLGKVQLYAIVKLLDYRLSTVGASRPQLTHRVVSAIKNGSVENDFGRFGLYLIYKCLFNAAMDAVKK